MAYIYYFPAGNTHTDFSISSTGVITVATGKTLDSTTTATYTLVVNAADDDTHSLTGSTTITVTVGGCSGARAFTALVTLLVTAFVSTHLL